MKRLFNYVMNRAAYKTDYDLAVQLDAKLDECLNLKAQEAMAWAELKARTDRILAESRARRLAVMGSI